MILFKKWNLLNKLKKIIIISCIAILPWPLMISCSSSYNKENKLNFSQLVRSSEPTFNFSHFIQTKANNNLDVFHNIKIAKWKDGDTVDVVSTQPIHGSATFTIRINGIDTPELHKQEGSQWVQTEGQEFLWANKVYNFAKKEMPKGAAIKIITNGDKTYGRLVGSIFYGKKFEKNFATEVIKAGLSIPSFGDSKISMALVEEQTIEYYLGIPYYDAYVYSKNNKKELNSLSTSELSKVYKIHGSLQNSLPQLISKLKKVDKYKERMDILKQFQIYI